MLGLARSLSALTSAGLAATFQSGAAARALVSSMILRGQSIPLSGFLEGKEPDRGTDRALQPKRCFNFDGTDDHIVVPGPVSLAGEFTVTWWAARGSTAGVDIVLGSSSSTAKIGYNTGNDIFVRVKNAGSSATVASGVDTTAFHKVTVTRDASNKVDLYVNGILVSRLFSDVAQSGAFTLGYFGRDDTGSANHYLGKIFDLQVFDSALTASEVALHYSLMTDALPLEARYLWYKCDDQHATIAYDSSGNGLNGTKTNITATTAGFFHEGSTVPFSYQNDKGWSTGLIPRDESDKTKDVTGATLTYSGRCPRNAQLVNANCATFDGVNDYVDVGNVSASIKSIEFWCKPSSITAHTDWVIDLNGTDYITIVNGTVTANGFSAATVTIYVDGVASAAIPNVTAWHHVAIVSDTGFSGSDVDIGRLEATGFYGGSLLGVRLFSDSLTADEVAGEYALSGAALDNLVLDQPFCEGAGTQISDCTDSHPGVATNITEATFWGTKQSIYHRNIVSGFTKYEHATSNPVYVPYANSGSPLTFTPATGYAKELDHPAGAYHNHAESEVDFTSAVPNAFGTRDYALPVNSIGVSEQFASASWSKTRSSVIPGSLLSPNGNLTGCKLILDGSAATDHRLSKAATGLVSGVSYVFSVFAKASDFDWLVLYDGNGHGKYFDIANGSVGSNFVAAVNDSGVEEYQNGWYRCWIAFTSGSTTVTSFLYLAEADGDIAIDGDSSSGVYIWGAQLERGVVPGVYVPTDLSNTPLQDFHPKTPELIKYNSEFSNAYWTTKANVTITDNAIADPITGLTTADRLTASAVLGVHGIEFMHSSTMTSGKQYVSSIIVKPDGYNFLLMYTTNPSTGNYFDLANKTVVGTFLGGASDAWVDDLGGGWVRCNILQTASSTGGKFAFYFGETAAVPNYTGDGVSGIYVCQASLKRFFKTNPVFRRQRTDSSVHTRSDRLTVYDRVLVDSRLASVQSWVETKVDS